MYEALSLGPYSEKLWIKFAELEINDANKRNAYAEAREFMPDSETIWMKLVELEPPEQARGMLRAAVECCHCEVGLWLALSKLTFELSGYEEANRVLKEANEKNPKNHHIWIATAKLHERAGKLE
jgi:tetratricopeptide (TPR) repeat protein